MSVATIAERAERRLTQFERRLLDDAVSIGHTDAPALVRHAVDLVGHVALPVVCDVDLLHLMRINFFTDAEALPYWVEGRILLSPLWQDLGDGLYAMDPVLRRLLLQRLIARRGPVRTAQVATLLWQTAERHSGWAERSELRHAQQLTALNFLAPERASEWLAHAQRAGEGESFAPEWFVAMSGELPSLPRPAEQAGDPEVMCELLLALTLRGSGSFTVGVSRAKVLIGPAGAALDWQLLQLLSGRSPAPCVLWLEIDPGGGGQRLLARVPGRRDRIAVTPNDALLGSLVGSSSECAIVIDIARTFDLEAMRSWTRRFEGFELFLLNPRPMSDAGLPPGYAQLNRELESRGDRRQVFDMDTLGQWFKSVGPRLPPALQSDDVGDWVLRADALLKETGGVPERVFESLCSSAGVRWPDVQAIARKRLEPSAPIAARDLLLALARRYDAIRAEMPAGVSRTTLMEDIVARMQPLLADTPADVATPWFTHASPGVRLLAVRWLLEYPSALQCGWLAQRVIEEKPFVGYHALLALQAAARSLPLGQLDSLDDSLGEIAEKLARLQQDSDRLRAFREAQRIVRARHEAAELFSISLFLLPGENKTWSGGANESSSAVRESATVFCRTREDPTEHSPVGTLADVLGGDGDALRLQGRARVRVARPVGMDGPTRVEVVPYPEEPAPPTPEPAWKRLNSALLALARTDLASAHIWGDLPLENMDDLYLCLSLLGDDEGAKSVYVMQDRAQKLNLALALFIRSIEQRLPEQIATDVARRNDLRSLLGRLFTTPDDQRLVATGNDGGENGTRRIEWPPARPGRIELARALALRPNEPTLLQAIKDAQRDANSKLSPLRPWPVGSTLHVRFIGGDGFRRERVLKYARQWFEHANLKLVALGPRSTQTAELRVAFVETDGSWSYLGMDALSVPADQPTMNLGWVGPNVGEGEARLAILKEFGHALGLIQEHQNPNRNFEWNDSAVIKNLSGPPNLWDRETIRQNVLRAYEPFDYRPFDPDSVMLYRFDANWFKGKNARAIGGATKLSDSDKALIAKLYPKRGRSSGREAAAQPKTSARSKRSHRVPGPLRRKK